ncbi:MAG: hypothetical protein HC863_01275 [Myxococcales bacterium]|nr:hypothetical protein [Myxococcales bacterium]
MTHKISGHWCARILYENHRSDNNGFGLHLLICAMVGDRLGVDAYTAKNHLDGNPRKGVSYVLRDCGERVGDAFPDLPREARFALVDGDALHTELGMPATSDLDARRAELTKRYPEVQMFTPDAPTANGSNTEALLRSAAQGLGYAEDDRTLVSALGKNRNARDKIFFAAADSPTPSVRALFRERQPSVAKLVDALAELVRPRLHAPAAPATAT